jgi:lipoprotein-releasing system ATP-binding protein
MNAPLLRLRGVFKSFPVAGGEPVEVLKGVSLEMERGTSLAIMGPSGCGKSTLMNLIGALDVPDLGDLEFQGRSLAALSEDERAAVRNREIGFVFQLHHLLPQCTALENALVPQLAFHARVPAEAAARAVRLLRRVGLEHRQDSLPGVLSGGERQRVALVRALVAQPVLLLADEPTGSLDAKGSGEILTLLLELVKEENLALITVTHASSVAERMARSLRLEDGVLAQAKPS